MVSAVAFVGLGNGDAAGEEGALLRNCLHECYDAVISVPACNSLRLNI